MTTTAPALRFHHPTLGKPEMVCPFVQPDGTLIGYEVRFPGKRILPLTPTGEWRAFWQPDKRPLANLDRISTEPDKTIIVCEGPKAMFAAQRLFPGYICTCWPGGTNSRAQVDFGPLYRRRVIYWPDADGPGIECMNEIYMEHAPFCERSFVLPPADAPKGWDAADLEAEKPPDPNAWLKTALKLHDEWRAAVDPIMTAYRMELETKRATVREKRPARNGWPGPPAADPTDPGPVDLVPGIPDEPSILFEGPPVPLDAPDLPPLCPELFPGFLGGMIKATAQATETPPELAGLLGLAAVAACVQGKAVVCPSPDYREPLCLYVAPALDSGNRKTSVLMEMTRPLREWERKRADEIQPEADKAASMRKTLEARADYLRKQAAKAESLELENLTVEIEEVERKIPEIPVLPRLWAQDVTPERLGALMAENQERIALISDEAGIFEILEGRYSGGIPNLDLFLQGHAGAPVRVDRGSRKAVYLQSPCLTLALSPQPEVIRGLALKPGFRGRGLLARFLYALPPSPLGWRKLTSKPTPQSVRDAYARGLRALLDTPSVIGEDGEPVPVVFEFSDDAFSEWREFSAATERELREDGEYAQITDWAGKLPGAAARIAGLLHCVQHAGAVSFPTAISRDTVQSALEIAAILSKHALAAFGLMGADPAIEGAKRVWRWIKTSRVKSFTARECFQALKGTFGRMGELQPALAVLVERAYIAEAPREKCNVPGRPSKTYTVNPALTEEWA